MLYLIKSLIISDFREMNKLYAFHDLSLDFFLEEYIETNICKSTVKKNTQSVAIDDQKE